MEILLARQPIFDKHEKVYAYELLYRSQQCRNGFGNVDGNTASAKVIVDSFLSLGMSQITGGKKAFINFTRRLLLDEYISLLPPEQVVVEVLENVVPDEQIVEVCKNLKSKGYLLALDDFVDGKEMGPLIQLADIIKVDFLTTPKPERRRLVRRLAPLGIQLLAEKIETREALKEALRMGYSYFQGYFFSKPLLVSQKTIPGFKLTYLRLLQELHGEDFEFAEAEEHFKHDLSLSYKLLRLVNSAALGLSEQVESIKHALVLLGQENIRKWFSLIVLAEMASDKPQELLISSVIRAHFWQTIGEALGFFREKDKLFLAGMFSMIDAVLDRPLEEALASLPLAQDVKAALLEEENQLSEAVQVGQVYERGDWETLAQLCRRSGLPESRLAELYRQSVCLTQAVFETLPAPAV